MREAVEGPVKETEQIRISSNLRDNEIYIRKQCENCADILVRPMRLGEDRKVDCLMVYIEVAVSNTSGAAGIAHWINTYFHLPEEKKLDKNCELVHEVKKWVDAEYESGRVTVLTDEELLKVIDDASKKLGILLV